MTAHMPRMSKLQECTGGDAYSSSTVALYQLYVNEPAGSQTLAVVNMRATPPTTAFVKTQINNLDFLQIPIYQGGFMYGTDKSGFLSQLDVSSGSLKKLSSTRLLHNAGVWHPVLVQSSSGTQLLVVNTTNGGPQQQLDYMQRRASTVAPATGDDGLISGDDGGFKHTHSALSVFDLVSGDLVSSVPLTAPVT
jgi:hypothetical protein